MRVSSLLPPPALAIAGHLRRRLQRPPLRLRRRRRGPRPREILLLVAVSVTAAAAAATAADATDEGAALIPLDVRIGGS